MTSSIRQEPILPSLFLHLADAKAVADAILDNTFEDQQPLSTTDYNNAIVALNQIKQSLLFAHDSEF